MPTEITMPKLSDTMTEGTLISWNKAPGEKVERGDIIAEVETDKANMELEAFTSGILLETRVKAGEVVPVGAVIAIIGEAGEAAVTRPPETAPTAKETEPLESAEETAPTLQQPRQIPDTAPAVIRFAPKEKASPLVRRLARERGIDLGLVKGTGLDGRILRDDLESYLEQRDGKAPEPEPPPAATEAGPEAEFERLSPMRAAIARTVSNSWRTIPHFTVSADIDMAAAEALHHGFKEAGHGVTLTDIIIKATAVTLARFPRLNAAFGEERIIFHPEIHIGVAVDVENGLLVPVIRNCEVLSLKEIGLRSRDLIERAREGHIRMTELSGGTFTISNMGMFGIKEFSAIILPPQAGILAIGTVADRAIVRNGALAPARMMTVTLSADHRIVDGAYAARFIQQLVQALENPVRLLV